MRVSELLTEGVEQFLELTPSIKEHMADTENPHAVTKEDVGLGNLTNDLQAKDADFRSHKNAAVLDHPGGSVTTEKLADKAVTDTKIADGAVTDIKLAGGSVTAEKLKDGAVETAKLAEKAVTAEKIAKAAVGGDALKEGCVAEAALTSSLRNKIAQKVDKEEGKGLSRNDFTDADKTKLDLITVTDGEALAVDTGKLVTKDTPLTLCKTGRTYVKRKEETIATGVQAFYGADVDNINDYLWVSCQTTDGVYKVITRDGREAKQVLKGPTNKKCCYHRQGSYIYVSEMTDNIVSVYKGFNNSTGNATLLHTLTVSQTGDLVLRDVLVDEAGNVWVMYYTGLEGTSTRVFIELFNSEGTRQWFRFIRMRGKADTVYAAPANNDTVFDSRFRHALLHKGELYVATSLGEFISNIDSYTVGTNCKYAVVRLNTAGEVTGTYHAHSGAGDNNIMQDITILGNHIYAFARTYFWRFDIDGDGTGTKLLCLDTQSYRLRGIMPDYDGRLHALVQGADDVQYIMQARTDTDRDNVNQYTGNLLAKKELPETYTMARYTKRGMELIRYDETAEKITSTHYVPADICECISEA